MYLRFRNAVRDENGGSGMLVLTRKSSESVIVGSVKGLERTLRVTVLDIHDGRVRLGFETADDVPVHRQEVWEQLRARIVPRLLSRRARPDA
jgi:carbon storage regulator CsrA